MVDRFATKADIEAATAPCRVAEAIELLERHGGYEALAGAGLAGRLAELCPAGGPVVAYDRASGIARVLTGDTHVETISASGRGKTRRALLPTALTIALSGQSIFCNDPKAELLGELSPILELAGYSVSVLDLRDPARTPDRYNPLRMAHDAYARGDYDRSSSVLSEVAAAIWPPDKGGDDPYWFSSATSWFLALSEALLEQGCPPALFNIATITTLNSMYQSDGPLVTGMFRRCPNFPMAKSLSETVTGAPTETRRSILSVFLGQIGKYSSQNGLMSALGDSSFSPEDLAHGRAAAFIVTPDESGWLSSISALIISQFSSELIGCAARGGGRLPATCWFLLDELGNFTAPIAGFLDLVTAGRSRGLLIDAVVQSDAQLTGIYGAAAARTIVENLYNKVFLGTRDIECISRFSKQMGTYTAPSGRELPVMSEGALQRLERRGDASEAVFLAESLPPFVSSLPDWDCYPHVPAPKPRGGADTGNQRSGAEAP